MFDWKYLGFDRQEILDKGGIHTAKEIAGQPELWSEVYDLVFSNRKLLTAFLHPLLELQDLRIILTGAGSSAFIGEAAQGIFLEETGKIAQAIATTDLVTHPTHFFLKSIPTLMISFARSGNSPESVEAVRLANENCDKIFHLIITCNKAGQLVKDFKGKNIHAFILPEKSNDISLAMTGSFTSMLVAGILIAKIDRIESLLESLDRLKEEARHFFEGYLPLIRGIADNRYERVIFLGSGSLLGIARECHLKLQELTDGKVICKHDSFLGFRHGPRAVTNKRSLVVYLFSNDDKVFQYEKDLATSISAHSPEVPTICFGREIKGLKNVLMSVTFKNDSDSADELAIVLPTLMGQILGFYQSVMLGLKPDNPSVSGTISRVVQGVTIYQ